jgi:hypothetical protein
MILDITERGSSSQMGRSCASEDGGSPDEHRGHYTIFIYRRRMPPSMRKVVYNITQKSARSNLIPKRSSMTKTFLDQF